MRPWSWMGCLLLASLLAWPAPARATCSGSGTSWACTAGSTQAQVQSAVSSASANAVITFDTGTYSWGSSVSLNGKNGLSLLCASVGGCTMTGSGFTMDSISSTITNLLRISGFAFSQSFSIWLYGSQNLTQVRIDHNTFTDLGTSSIGIHLGENTSTGRIYGVIDHNTFQGTVNFMGMKVLGGPPGTNGADWVTGVMGSANNMFIEDNTWNFSDNTDLGSGGVDAWHAVGVVFRYNTLFNSRIVAHDLCHGGPVSMEVYHNTVSSPTPAGQPQYRNLHFQGTGEAIAFENTLGGTGATGSTTGGHYEMLHYRGDSGLLPSGQCINVCDGTWVGNGDTIPNPTDGNRGGTSPYTGSGYAGYPCWHQPGRDKNAVLKPTYNWGNVNQSGNAVPMRRGGGTTNHVIADRDFYEAVSTTAQTSPTSPFNGTTGMGFGTLANRPTTCTPTLEPLDSGQGGVGYWATDAPSSNWNTSNGAGNDGALYRCSATNTWTLAYMPYTYPHPLVTGASAPPTAVITAPNSGNPTTVSTTPLTTLAGTATDDVGVTSVTWICPTCTPTSGAATCATCGSAATSVSWSVASVGLASGANVITVTANDADTQTGTDTLTVTYTPVTAAPTILRLGIVP